MNTSNTTSSTEGLQAVVARIRDSVDRWEGSEGAVCDRADLLFVLDALAAAGAGQPLTMVKLNDIARDAQIAFCLGKFDSFDVAFARGIEVAHNITARSTQEEARNV